MASGSNKLTKYKSAVTIVTSDVANAWYGGLYGSSEAASLAADDPKVIGHVHDGEHCDGHAGKVDLVNHVSNQLKNANLADDAVVARNVRGFTSQSSAIPEFEIIDSTTYYYLDLSDVRGDIGSGSADLNPALNIVGMENDYPLDFVSGGVYNASLNVQINTVTFPAATEDQTVRRILFNLANPSTNAGSQFEQSSPNILDIKINGISLVSVDTGFPVDVVFGNFLNHTDGIYYELDIPLSLGDILSLDIGSQQKGAIGGVAYTWTSGITGVGEKRILSTLAFDGFLPAPPLKGATKATVAITIDSTPVTSSFQFNSRFTRGSFSLYASGTGSRTSGSDDFASTGTTAQIAQSIYDAINDGANSFTEFTAISAVSNVVTIEYSNGFGPAGNLVELTLKPSQVTSADAFSGGVLGVSKTLSFPAAPADGTIKNLFLTTLPLDDEVASAYLNISAMNIDGGANLISGNIPGGIFAADSDGIEKYTNNSKNSPNLNIPILSGEVFSIDFESAGLNDISILAMTVIMELD